MKKRLLLLCCLLLFFGGISQAQSTRQVKGNVKDAETNEALAGVSVLVKGTSTGTVTDVDGNFELNNLPQDGQINLIFTYVGFLSQTIELGNQTELNISLQTDKKALDEIVVIGYGEVNRRDVAGAIVSVKNEDLVKIPSTNVMESLQGKLPGVDITRNSGEAGSGVNVTVRGNRSITANNNPLFIVDGIQYSSIQDINPNDIESMEVLKDASTTAIYGSRGANGVIIVTTKRAKKDQLRFSFNSYIGVSSVQIPKFNDGAGYAAQRLEARRTINTDGTFGDLPAVNTVFTTQFLQDQIANNRSTNWTDLFIKDGMQQDYQLSVAAGGAKTNLYLSLDYFKEDAMFRNAYFNRYTIRFNIDHSLTEKLKIGLQNQITYSDAFRRSDPLSNAGKINPLFNTTDANGNLEFLVEGRFVNPLFDELPDNYLNNQRISRVFSTLYLDAKILSSLSLRSNFGIILGNTRTGIFRGSQTVDRAGSASQAVYETGRGVNFTWENILTFKKKFGEHSFTATGVTTLLTNREEGQSAQGFNQLLNSQLFYGLGNAPDQVSIFSGYEETTLISFTGRLNYSFKGKYILSATIRTDGASQLAEGRKWAEFLSASAAWQVIDEEFMKNQKIFSNLKLRVGYGTAGNYAVGPYSTASLTTRIPYSFDETSATGNRFNPRIGNPFLGWELSNTINLGIDFGVMNDRITGSIDLYNTRTKDLLLQRSLPPTSGVSSIIENIGKTRNKGIEVALNALIIRKGDFNWNVGVNWFANKEEITELPNGQKQDLVNRWFVGSPTRAFYDFEKIGIWQNSEAEEALTFGRKPGEIKVKDQNGDGIINDQDRIVLGSIVPKWNANFSTDISYKGLDFSMQLFARVGQMMDYGYAALFDPQGVENSVDVDYWTPNNPTNDYPRPSSSISRTSLPFFTTLQYKDASFLKLRAITLGYSLPKSWIEKVKLSKARVYITGRNVFTITEVENYDPERGGAVSNPIPRLWVGGINLEF
jgi:TonB-linked SusC/RagA family outer membrane protein